jgi:hypothetical protein
MLPDYKDNWEYSPLFLTSFQLFFKYFIYRGFNIQLVYSDSQEEDDFFEPILELIKEKHKLIYNLLYISLVTSGHDC